MDESKVRHGSNISRIFSIYDLLRMLQTSNFSICFTLEKYGYPENWISKKYRYLHIFKNPYASPIFCLMKIN